MKIGGHERVSDALARLASSTPEYGSIEALDIGGLHRISEIKLGKDHSGLIHVIIEKQPDAPRFALRTGPLLPVAWVPSTPQRSNDLLDLTCADPRLIETFASLVGEMLERVDGTAESATDALQRVVADWRTALERAAERANLNQLIGLFGELVVLERLAESDPARAFRAWRGKSGYHHDFALTNALEVKTYVTLNSPRASIHGAYQLDPPEHGSLHLATFRVEEGEAGLSVSELLDRIVRLGIDREDLLSRSGEAGPLVADDKRRFLITEERLYHVVDDFPGVRASRLDPRSLAGVEDLSFKLILDACPGRRDSADLSTVLDEL